jgi:hypothetical protein
MTRGGSTSWWDEGARLRANPAYDIVSRDALTPACAALARALDAVPEVYGAAVPREPARLAPKALDCDTALLLLSLREPATLPWFARVKLGHRARPVIETLVLEGVLEVERDGSFVSGPALLVDTAETLDSAVRARDACRLTRLSHAALAYGAALSIDDADALARRLYGYHAVPLSPAWQARLGDRASVERHLGLDREPVRRALAAGWTTAGHAHGPPQHWIFWHPVRRGDERPPDAAYKLYVSCAVERLGDAFGAVVDTLARLGGAPFKVGAHATGLLRPDKLVIYLDRLDAVFELGAALRGALDGVPPHGVPFTGPVTGDGLLSWAIDPPRGSGAEALRGGRSWRARLTTQLAASLVAARRQGCGAAAAARFAVERIRRAGVDPDTWAPRSERWEGTGADD